MDWNDFKSNRVNLADGTRLHYHDAGVGDPIVLVHGAGAGASAALSWWRNIAELAESFRVLAVDLPGFGHTETSPDTEFGIRYWSDSIRAFLDALEIDTAAIVGNSLGGWVATDFAVRHSEALTSLVLSSPGGYKGSSTPAVARSQSGSASTSDDIRELLTGFVYDPSIITDELIAARSELMRMPGAAERHRATSAARQRDREEYPLKDEMLAAIAVPTLVIHGRDDVIVPTEHSQRIAQAVPDADLHVFGRCGHWAHVERAADFNGLVTSFLLSTAANSEEG